MTEYSTHIKTLILVQINSNENRIKGWGSRIIQRQSTLGTGPRMKTKRRSNTDSTHKKPGVLSKGNQFLLVIGHGVLSKGNQFLLVIGPVVLSKGNQFPLVIGTGVLSKGNQFLLVIGPGVLSKGNQFLLVIGPGVLSKGNQFLLVIGEWSLELKKNQTDLSLYKSLRNYLFTAFANYFVDRKYEVNSWIDIGIVLFILSLLSLHCSPLTL
jgi:phosphotransferase system IIB component